MHDEAVRRAFLRQAKACDSLGSPFTARLCNLIAARLDRQTEVGATVLSWVSDPDSTGDSLPLRLAGALHALVLLEKIEPLTVIAMDDEDALWDTCESALRFHAPFILDRLKSPPQTNEVRRSAALLPGFFEIARLTAKSLVLSEVGASAGLNLQFDRYRYRLGGLEWGENSEVVLIPEWRGPSPRIAPITILERAGCDISPLDPSSDEDRLQLMSYIWADQPDRLERTASALRMAVKTKIDIEKADALDWLEQRLSKSFHDAAHVVFHSIAWQYLPEKRKQIGEAMFAAAGERATDYAPLARLQMEADTRRGGASLTLQLWPSGEKREIGRADFHGRWIDWRGWGA